MHRATFDIWVGVQYWHTRVIRHCPGKTHFKGRCLRHSCLPSLWHTYMRSSLRLYGLVVVESWYHAPYGSFLGIFDFFVWSNQMASWSIHQVFNWHQIWHVFIFYIDSFNSRTTCRNSYQNLDFWGYGLRLYLLSLSLSLIQLLSSFSPIFFFFFFFLSFKSKTIPYFKVYQ